MLDGSHQVGYACSIIKESKVILQECFGYANLEEKRKVDKDTLFPIASISKIITAIGLMILFQGNKEKKRKIKEF